MASRAAIEASVEQTAHVLEHLQPGSRAWYWFCPRSDEPRLVLVWPERDRRMKRLEEWSARRQPIGAPASMGFVHARHDGTLDFYSSNAEASWLPAMASWARHHSATHPSVARLAHCGMIRVDMDGVASTRIEDASLWTGLPRFLVPGSLAHTEHTLDGLEEGDTYWYWLATRGPDQLARLALYPTNHDPTGASFSILKRSMERRDTTPSDAMSGVMFVGPSRRPAFTTNQPVHGWRLRIAAVLRDHLEAHPGLHALLSSTMALVGPDHVSRPIPFDPDVHLSHAVETLETLTPSTNAYFWFTPRSMGGRCSLLIDTDRDRLRHATRIVRGDGLPVRGRVGRTSEGSVCFRARAPTNVWAPQLVRWATRNQRRSPHIDSLREARFQQVDRAGNVLRELRGPSL